MGLRVIVVLLTVMAVVCRSSQARAEVVGCEALSSFRNSDSDSSSALQGCIDQAPEGAELAIPAGVYTLARTVRISRPISLVSEGTTPNSLPCGQASGTGCATFFRAPQFSGGARAPGVRTQKAKDESVVEVAGEGVSLDHLVFEGLASLAAEKQGDSLDGQLLRLHNCSSCSVSSVVVSGSPYSSGLGIDGGRGIVITRSVFAKNGTGSALSSGVKVRKSQGVRIVGNEATGNSLFGLSLASCESCEVRDNLVWYPSAEGRNAVAGIRVAGQSVSVRDNWVDCAGTQCNTAFLFGKPREDGSREPVASGSVDVRNNVAFNSPFGFFFGNGAAIRASGNVPAGGTGTLVCSKRGFSAFARASGAEVEIPGTEVVSASFSPHPISAKEALACSALPLESSKDEKHLRARGARAAQSAVKALFMRELGRLPSQPELGRYAELLLSGQHSTLEVAGRILALRSSEALKTFRDSDGIAPLHVRGASDASCLAQLGEDAVFDGDIKVGGVFAKSKGEASVAGYSFVGGIWPGGQVPYELDSTVSAALRGEIAEAIQVYNAVPGLLLRPRTTGDRDWVRFRVVSQPGAAWLGLSFVGRKRGEQTIDFNQAYLATTSLSFLQSTALHEIGHALGLVHEHQRPDRDAYVEVRYANLVSPLARSDLDIKAPEQSGLPDYLVQGPYDFSSIMHYGSFIYSRAAGLPVLLRKAGLQRLNIPNPTQLSAGDRAALATLYASSDDLGALTVSIAALPPDSRPAFRSFFRLGVTFSRPVQGLSASDFEVSNGSISSLSGSEDSYQIFLAQSTQGAVSLSLPPARAVDNRGRPNEASNTLRVVSAVGAPIVEDVSGDSGVYPSGSVDVRVNLNETVLVAGAPYLELNVGNPRARALYVGGSGTDVLVFRYTVVSTHESLDLDCVRLVIPAGGSIKDLAGTAYSGALPPAGSARSLAGTTDIIISQRPNALLTSSLAAEKPAAEIPVSVTFNVPISGLEASDFIVTNGTLSSLLGSGRSYTARVAASGDGAVSVKLPENAVSSIPGGKGNFSSNLLTRTGRASPVTISRVSAASRSYAPGSLLKVEVTFAEAVAFSGGAQDSAEIVLGDPSDPVIARLEQASSGRQQMGGSTRLVFWGTVPSSVRTSRLSYPPGSSLRASLVSVTGAPVSLVLPEPGSPGALDTTSEVRLDGLLDTTGPTLTITESSRSLTRDEWVSFEVLASEYLDLTRPLNPQKLQITGGCIKSLKWGDNDPLKDRRQIYLQVLFTGGPLTVKALPGFVTDVLGNDNVESQALQLRESFRPQPVPLSRGNLCVQ